MSVKCSAAVWQYARAKGGELLVLLAIADYAKDDGSGAWPSIDKLCAKTRFSERNVHYLLRRLQRSGELEVLAGAGPRGCNLYRVVLDGWLTEPEDASDPAKIAPAKIAPANFAGVQNELARGCKMNSRGGAKSRSGGVQRVAPEPLRDPSEEPSRDPSSIAAAPRRARDPLWDAFVAVFGFTPATESERGRWNRCLKQLRDLGASAGDIATRAGHYEAKYSTPLTPEALVKRWGELEVTPRARASPNGRASPTDSFERSRESISAVTDAWRKR